MKSADGSARRATAMPCRQLATRIARHAVVVCAALLLGHVAAAQSWRNPVKVVAADRMTVTTGAGSGEMPLLLSADWTHPLPDIRRAVIVLHGIDRNVAATMRGAEAARAAAGPAGQDTLLIAPQFLAPIDVTRLSLPDATLRWGIDGWSAGDAALGPAPIASFAVFDAILQRLADRSILPNLSEVVVAGHSAGGQFVQRYAVVGHGSPALATRGIALRYVVANPSSYLYFSADRPEPAIAAACWDFNRWRYGLADAPPYVGATAGLEARYAARNVIYLLGTADDNPNHPALDKRCGAEAQGPYRLARGQAYFAYLMARHPGMSAQRLVLVPGVAHSSTRMFGSVCGIAALFDRPGCPGLPQ